MFGDNKKWRAAEEAIRNDDAAKITGLQKNLFYEMYKNGKYFNACKLAISSNAPNALRELMKEGKGFRFSDDAASSYAGWNKKRARELVNAALSTPEPGPLLSVLYDANKITAPKIKLDDKDFLTDATPVSLLQKCLEDNPENYRDALLRTGLASTEKLKFILTFTSKCAEPQSALDAAFVQVAAAGDIEKAKLLLERKADPNYASAQPLAYASENGHMAMVEFLLPLTRLDLYGDDLTTQLKQKGAPAEAVSSILAATRGVGPAAAAAEPGDYALVDADTICGTQNLPDGATLTTIFNFRAKQEQLILKSPDTPQATLYAVNFSDVDKEVIAAMREKLDELKAGSPATPRTKAKTSIHL